MRNLSPELSAHLGGACTTLCHCWKLIRNDGAVLGFTDHDSSITFDAAKFEALAGFQASAAEAMLGLNIDSQEVAGAFSSNLLNEDDLAAGLYDNARVETWLVNWQNISEREFLRVGFLGEITREDTQFVAELRSLTNQLDQTKGRRFMPLCDAVLGDDKCGVDLQISQNLGSGIISGIRSGLSFVADGVGAFQDNWFARGRLSWTSGANAGLAVEISQSINENGGTVIQLWKPMPFELSPNDTFLITTGCDKCFETCKGKFSNQQNFRGFPHMPGNDFSLTYADKSTDHDGSPLVS